MKLEDQVVSLELAKRLKELGVRQDSYFHHLLCDDKWIIENVFDHDTRTGEWGNGHTWCGHENYSAFTVAELGELLPKEIEIETDVYMHLMTGVDFSGDWFMNYAECEFDKKEANVRAKALIWLIENNKMGGIAMT